MNARDPIPSYEGLLDAAIEDLLREPREAERLVRRIAEAHRLLVLGRLAASVAHDVNNQLTVALSCASSLLDPGPRPTDGEALADAFAAIQHAAAICRQVLDLVRPARRQGDRYDVNAVLGRLPTLLRRLGTTSGLGLIDVEVRPSPEPAWTMGDEAQLSNALLNLAVNARDAMPRGGRLGLRAALVDGDARAVADRRRVRVDVADTGAGIPSELLPRLFDPFFTTKAEGSGLGLASVREAVERHRGTIEVWSKVGEGTTFTILLPHAAPPA